MSDELVSIAKISKPRGLRGEVIADVLTDFPDRFENLERVYAVGGEGIDRELTLEGHWFQKNRVILKFAGFDSIESVEELRNLEICIPESETVELEADTFFDWNLEGCRVITQTGTPLGMVKEVYRAGENVNLVVAGSEKEYLVPFVSAICTDVDIEKKLIRVDPPEGLLDF